MEADVEPRGFASWEVWGSDGLRRLVRRPGAIALAVLVPALVLLAWRPSSLTGGLAMASGGIAMASSGMTALLDPWDSYWRKAPVIAPGPVVVRLEGAASVLFGAVFIVFGMLALLAALLESLSHA